MNQPLRAPGHAVHYNEPAFAASNRDGGDARGAVRGAVVAGRPRVDIGPTTEATERTERVNIRSGPDPQNLRVLCGSILDSGRTLAACGPVWLSYTVTKENS